MVPQHQQVEATVTKWGADHALDCVEPLPISGQSVRGSFDAVVGAYTLAQDQERVGGLYHVRCSPSDSKIESLGFAPSPAVLDTRVVSFSESNAGIVVLTACADGNLRCHEFPSLNILWAYSHGKMITSLSTITSSSSNDSVSVTFSDSSGGIALVEASRTGCKKVWASDVSSPIHAAEAWTVDGADTSLLISGGDDGYLCATDLRTTNTAWKKRAHNSVGVTTVVCPSTDNSELWTGGYDDHVRLWDLRKMRVPLAEKNLGGGVWRLKFHPSDPSTILAACMYDGFKVLERKEDTLEIATEYRQHESIAYGAAWLSNGDECSSSYALTASFYDKSLQLWKPSAS